MANGQAGEGIAVVATLARDGSAAVTLHDSVSAFYVEHRQALYRYVLLMGALPAEAQELTQEAFLSLYGVLRRGETVFNWRGWVFRVAHNLAVNRARASGPSRSLDEISAPQIAAHGIDPETLAINQQRQRRLHAAIARLSAQQRHCLFLRAEGFRYREIADILGIAQPTAGEFLRRAILQLRKEDL
jgi:RNA polymerase sigma-70 factor (ECF subfamily)